MDRPTISDRFFKESKNTLAEKNVPDRFRLPMEIAGWSSPVARQAHNLKVVGSNPTPATNLKFFKMVAFSKYEHGNDLVSVMWGVLLQRGHGTSRMAQPE